MKAKLFVQFMLLAIFASACGWRSTQTIEVPDYTTNGAAIYAAMNEATTPWGYVMPTYLDSEANATLTKGPLGLIIKKYAIDDTFDKNGFGNFGQTCGLVSFDEITFDSETKTITAIFLASTNDQNFLRWCQNQVKKSMAVYVVNVEEATEGFLIKYHVEYWQTKVIFRIDK